MARPTAKNQAIRDAKALISNPALITIMEELKQELIDGWVNSSTTDVRELHHTKLKTVEWLEEEINDRANRKSS